MLRWGKPGLGRLVLLHGWCADGQDLLSLGKYLMKGLGDVVALEAPEPHPHVPGGRQWYPLTQETQEQGWPGVSNALAYINHHLVYLRQEHPWPQTALLGFSQGAAMALEASVNKPLAGVVACSGYPHSNRPLKDIGIPVLLIHGQNDPVVPLQASFQLQVLLEAQGCDIELQSFATGHSIPSEALASIRQFLERCFIPTSSETRIMDKGS